MSGPAVLISTNTLPCATPAAPSAPRYAARTAFASVSIEITTSAPTAASAGVAATLPTPSACARSRVRFHSVSSWPAALRRRAIAPPIFPVPRMATRIAALLADVFETDRAVSKRFCYVPPPSSAVSSFDLTRTTSERRTLSLLRALRQQGCRQGGRRQRRRFGHRRHGGDHRLAVERLRQRAGRWAPQCRRRPDQLHPALHLRARPPPGDQAIFLRLRPLRGRGDAAHHRGDHRHSRRGGGGNRRPTGPTRPPPPQSRSPSPRPSWAERQPWGNRSQSGGRPRYRGGVVGGGRNPFPHRR